MKKQLHAQGDWAPHPDEIYAMGKLGIDALATFLADKPYLMGDRIQRSGRDGLCLCRQPDCSTAGYPVGHHRTCAPNLVDCCCARIKAAQYWT